MTPPFRHIPALRYWYPCRTRLTAEAYADLGKPLVRQLERMGLVECQRLGGFGNKTVTTITNAGATLAGYPRVRKYTPPVLRTSLLVGHVAHKVGWQITDGSDVGFDLPPKLVYLHDRARDIVFRPLTPALTASVESTGKTVVNLFSRLAERCQPAINAGRVRALVVLSHGELAKHKAEQIAALKNSRSEEISSAMAALNVEIFRAELLAI